MKALNEAHLIGPFGSHGQKMNPVLKMIDNINLLTLNLFFFYYFSNFLLFHFFSVFQSIFFP